MASTYTPIATTTLGADTASVTFSSISSAYTDLVLVLNWTSSTSEFPMLQFNGDTATNYSWTDVVGNGTSALSYRGSNVAGVYTLTYAGATWSNAIWNIQNYSNTTTYKTVLTRANGTGSYTEANVGLWRNTSAINSIKVTFQTASNYKTGSTFTLYGIKAA